MHVDIQLPDNKSVVIRKMVADFALRGIVGGVPPEQCNDVKVVGRALALLDAAQKSPDVQEVAVIDVEDCGAAYRFTTALAAAIPANVLLTGTPRLLERPILPLAYALERAGASLSRTDDGWLIRGRRIEADCVEIDASLSSQLASALVLAAPLMNLHKVKLASADIPSLQYLRMSLAAMEGYDIAVEGVQPYAGPLGATGDWSAAAFWFAHACLNPQNTYSLHPLTAESIQGDSVITQWFTKLGVEMEYGADTVSLRCGKHSTLPALVLDMSQNLDLVPVMFALACALPADFTFLRTGNLQHKESDRLGQLVRQLAPYAEITDVVGGVRVVGRYGVDFSQAMFDTAGDHRLAMAFLLLTGPSHLSDTGCLRKSYPSLSAQLSGI